MRSILLPTSLLFMQAVVLHIVAPDPAAAGSRKFEKSSRNAPVRPTRKVMSRAKAASSGIASFYGRPQKVSSGGTFDPRAMTAAHRSLPFGTRVRVTHARNGRSVDVKINDRGPFIAGRIIDLSKAAAELIGMTANGIARVRITVLGP